MVRLGVNIDHVATLRQARKGLEPQPILAALTCRQAGADSIVVHLRQDRRHIQDHDLFLLRKVAGLRLNMEMSVAQEIVNIACRLRPDQTTLVPEKRQELTTEGGLDVVAHIKRVSEVAKRLQGCGILVSLFIDPDKRQVDAAHKAKVKMIELHTGRYANAANARERKQCLQELKRATSYALSRGLLVNAGHGLDYHNVSAVARIKGIAELNIGYSIVCRAVMVGLRTAVEEMKGLIRQAERSL